MKMKEGMYNLVTQYINKPYLFYNFKVIETLQSLRVPSHQKQTNGPVDVLDLEWCQTYTDSERLPGL